MKVLIICVVSDHAISSQLILFYSIMPSKSATTIRRRRRRAPGFSFSHALRIVHKKHLDEESIDLMAEDPDTDHGE